ncbi:MAG: ATP-binding cassette domain-containing protein, partial [Gammaproteobacteria bacterium]|nr:ATP-binding cassette domain-containing protein [Gammaproteobacteria bacterium]
MIRFDNACKRYPGGYDALRQVNFFIPSGQMAFLTGHSGAGKSTLLKLIVLLERPSRGQVFVNGQNLAKISRKRIPFFRREIGIIFQNHQLLFDRTVYDNVALPLIIAGSPHR